VHGTGVYSAGVGPKGPALERFLDIKKKKVFREGGELASGVEARPDVIVSGQYSTQFLAPHSSAGKRFCRYLSTQFF
jgi:hypothetical protein